jgi:outer membrane protein OmpA-like peptidoglycan-associated protein
VGHYLQHRGASASHLSTAGLGASLPRVPNTSRAGRRINRRVEIVIEDPGT